MAPVRRLVLDVLKPHEPPTVEVAERLCELAGVDAVNAMLLETDAEVQNLKLTIEGESIDHDRIETAIDRLGGSIHSVDSVVCGEYMIEGVPTPQD
jgi:hypothetical protein